MTNDTERRFTLDEAAAELRKQECRRFGHDWDVVAYGTLGNGGAGAAPVGIRCGRCGWSGRVTMGDRP